ncbi:hypothetical protein HK100_004552, partial [Physocladia obscura]
PQILAQFNNLIAKYESITSELHNLSSSTILLKQLLVVPQHLPPSDPDSIPRVLLRTRLDQELLDADENTRDEFTEQFRRSHSSLSLPEPTVNQLEQQALRVELKGWVNLVDMHDSVVAHATAVLDETSEEVLREIKTRPPVVEGRKVSIVRMQAKFEELSRWLVTGGKYEDFS